jgi:hypothetical protein
MIPATFRAAFAALEPQDVLTVLSWILEPGQGDPEPNMPDAWLDATLPLTKAYQANYEAMERALEPCHPEFWGDDTFWRDSQYAIDRGMGDAA